MTEENEPAARVTLSAIYGILVELQQTVNPLSRQVSDHEVRIRAIEKYFWVWLGAAGVSGGIVTQIANQLLSSN